MNSVDDVSLPKLMLKSARFLLLSSLFAFCSVFANAQVPNSPLATPETPTNSFVALCYHDVNNGFIGNSFSIRTKDLVEQFEYLKAHYNVISLQDVLDANQGKKTLPPKAVLITVDDGLVSFYENVYPLLKTYKFNAVFAIVGKWTEEGAAPDYGFKDSNPKMSNWKQLKEMMKSGLVEVVSHSYDLHQGQIFNPQGNQAAMASYFKYDAATKTYQPEEEFSANIQADLKKNNEVIKKHLGKDNTVVVWPYGKFNELSSKAAIATGHTIQMSLRPGLNYASDISQIGRGLVLANMDISKFATALEHAFVDKSPVRMIRVDLDSLWKKADGETEQGLGDLLEETLSLGPNAAMLQAVSDSGEAYFVTSHLKVRGDYLSRAAHTIKNRAQVLYTYAHLPRSFTRDMDAAKGAIRDLAKYTDFDGIFFEVSPKDDLKKIPFAELIASARSIRPQLQFGIIGQKNADPEMFDFAVITPQQLEKDRTPGNPDTKLIVALPKDYKHDASHLIAQGYVNLFFDVNFKGYTPDEDFKNLFSVLPTIPQHPRGEAK
ncbi:poly-beta-1,6-N-acetyl-D-glucosamine N-deacetylase PgaB [Bdellovibrio sp. HCB274]|uniref:poly-beta-1,6-N-acetyl-D-glucosamine N-deacetylase PgaB n=1 Tax=Bdellovibrio sp. HCB274 TaxID=3394361 RepID=UPI0039B39180